MLTLDVNTQLFGSTNFCLIKVFFLMGSKGTNEADREINNVTFTVVYCL
jgi:hypothetical protein